jgi:hypothetical protein
MPGDSQPLLPAPRDGDPEDVSWALQTADALWKRGEYADAVSWIRKAANAAADAEADMRVIELAKAAAELSALVEAFGARAPEPRVPSGVDIEVAVEVEPSPAPPLLTPSSPPKKPPGPPPKKPGGSPRLPTPNPVPSPLQQVPFAEVASAATAEEIMPAPPRADPVPPSYDPDSARAFPSVPPEPPDFAPTPMAMPIAKSIPPDREPPPPKVQIAPPERKSGNRTSTMPLGTPDPNYVPVRPRALEPDPLDDPFALPAIEVPPKPMRPASVPPPNREDVVTSARSVPPPPRPGSRLGTPVMGSVPPPKMSLAPSAVPPADDDKGVQSHVSDAPPRAAKPSEVQIPAAPRAPRVIAESGAPPPSSSRTATIAGLPQRAPPPKVDMPALSAQPVSGRAVLLDPDQFEVLADVPDDAREALVMQSEKVALLPDESASAPAMVVVLQGEIDVRSRGHVTKLDSISQGQVRLLVAFAPAEGNLEVVGGPKGARYLALGISGIELLRAAAPWVVQELEPASDDVHVVAGILRGRHGARLDGPMLDAILSRAKTMRLAPGATVVRQGEAVRALIFVGAGELTIRGGNDADAQILQTLVPGEVLYSTELLGRVPAPSTVRAGDQGALVIVATRAATEELLVTVPPLLELLGEA